MTDNRAEQNAERDNDNAITSAADDGGGSSRHLNGDVGQGHHRRLTPLPPSIVQAICQIQVTVEAVKKSSRNAHGGYNFASTDDIYAAVTRKMGEVGLVLLSLEDRCEVKRVEKDGKTAQWAHFEFSFVLATTADTWSDERAKRTLFIQVTGPQTFQAAQSYAEKAYLRSLFKLPTGDMDLDSMPQADTEEDEAEMSMPIKAGNRKSSYAAKKDGVSVAAFQALLGAIAAAPDRESLQRIYMEHSDANGAWAGMPVKWAKLLQDDFQVRMEALAAQQFAE
jgi:hypothetical protein